MKKFIFFIIIMGILLLGGCNKAVCPAYSDSANNTKSSIFQSGSYRANGINKVYRDTYRKR